MEQDKAPPWARCRTSAERLACASMRQVSVIGKTQRCACSVCGESLSRPMQWPFPVATKRVEVAA